MHEYFWQGTSTSGNFFCMSHSGKFYIGIEIKGISSSSVKRCFLPKFLLEVFFTDFLCQSSHALQARGHSSHWTLNLVAPNCRHDDHDACPCIDDDCPRDNNMSRHDDPHHHDCAVTTTHAATKAAAATKTKVHPPSAPRRCKCKRDAPPGVSSLGSAAAATKTNVHPPVCATPL